MYVNLPQVDIARLKVTPLNIPKIPSGFEVPLNFAILNLDMDSYNLYVLESILKSGYQLEITSMEVNEKRPPRIFLQGSIGPICHGRAITFTVVA